MKQTKSDAVLCFRLPRDIKARVEAEARRRLCSQGAIARLALVRGLGLETEAENAGEVGRKEAEG
jgi:hypothetical protein